MKNKEIFIILKDFSEPGNVNPYGVHLAKHLNAPAVYYGPAKVPLITGPTNIIGDGRENSISLEMQATSERAQGLLSDLVGKSLKIYDRVSYKTDIGFPVSAIVDKTNNLSPYLTVIEGENELTTLHEWFGTYETRLAENINSPVLVLPSPYPYRPVKRILYLMDMDDHKVDNMRWLSGLSEDLQCALAVVVIGDTSNPEDGKRYERSIDVLRGMLGYQEVDFHRVLARESASAISQLITSLQADWLVFEHKSYNFLERMLDDYHTKRLILQSKIPVLVF